MTNCISRCLAVLVPAALLAGCVTTGQPVEAATDEPTPPPQAEAAQPQTAAASYDSPPLPNSNTTPLPPPTAADLDCHLHPYLVATIKALDQDTLYGLLQSNVIAFDVVHNWWGRLDGAAGTEAEKDLKTKLEALVNEIGAYDATRTKTFAQFLKERRENDLPLYVDAAVSDLVPIDPDPKNPNPKKLGFPLFSKDESRFDHYSVREAFLNVFMQQHNDAAPNAGGFGNMTWDDFYNKDSSRTKYTSYKLRHIIDGGHNFGIIPVPWFECIDTRTGKPVAVSAASGPSTCCCNTAAHGNYRKCVGTNNLYTCNQGTTYCALGSQNCGAVHTCVF